MLNYLSFITRCENEYAKGGKDLHFLYHQANTVSNTQIHKYIDRAAGGIILPAIRKIWMCAMIYTDFFERYKLVEFQENRYISTWVVSNTHIFCESRSIIHWENIISRVSFERYLFPKASVDLTEIWNENIKTEVSFSKFSSSNEYIYHSNSQIFCCKVFEMISFWFDGISNNWNVIQLIIFKCTWIHFVI